MSAKSVAALFCVEPKPVNPARATKLVLALVFVAACGRDPQATEVSHGAVTALDDDTSQAFAVPVGLASVGCRLYMNPDESQNLWLQTDARGYAKFWFGPTSAVTAAPIGHLDCTDDAGALHTQTIDLAQLGPQQAAIVAAMPPKPGTMFQPLAGDPESYGQADLLAMGLPPRPAKDSSKWAQWLDIASRPRFRPAGRSLPNPDIKRPSYINSDHWCGDVILPGGSPFIEAIGVWHMPTWVSGVTVTAVSTTWVGLSGFGQDELIQAGMDVGNVPNGSGGWTYNYAVFWEYYSTLYGDRQGSLSVSAFPGDNYYFDIWASNVSGGMTATGGYATYYVYDYTDSSTDTQTEVAPSGSTYHGASAEFITERPWSGSSWMPFARTNLIQITSHAAWDGTGWRDPADGLFYYNVTMKNASNQVMCGSSHDSSGWTNNQWYRKD